MKIPFFTKLKAYLREANQWLLQTPERSLEQAYKAALIIKTIEDEHFDGEKISTARCNYGDSAMSYFLADLKKYLNTAKLRLAEFKASRSVMLRSEQNLLKSSVRENPTPSTALEIREEPSSIIDKLKFVDEIIEKYNNGKNSNSSSSLVPVTKSNVVKVDKNSIQQNRALYQLTPSTKSTVIEADIFSDKTGMPRSIGRTFERIQQQLDPKAEEQVIQKFRNSKKKTLISVKFIFILIIVPILTQQVSTNFIVGPIIDHLINPHKPEIFLNIGLEEEALREMQIFEEQLKFKTLIGQDTTQSQEEREEQLKHKASEIEEEYRGKSANAIKNVFADTIALIAFCYILVISKPKIKIVQSFINEVSYSLSDSAKAFMIILFTDMFVGFHSPHGWEVILEGVLRHLGLQENESFISLFIATFPVILDTIFKYWIFRYLSRMSPSAVATYRNMNE